MMKKKITLLLLLVSATTIQAQSVLGEWFTFDSETGEKNSIVEIYEEDGEFHGKVVKLLRDEDKDRKCTKCTGNLKNKPIEGMVVLRDMEKNGDEFKGGVITDPKSGKNYKSKMWLDEEDPGKLKVRGYVGFLYETRTWERVK